MTDLKLQLLMDAIRIHSKRDNVTAAEAIAKYPALTDEEKAPITAALQ